MKKRTNIKIAFIICALLLLAFMVSGLGFFADNAFAAAQENSAFIGDKSTRLLLVLDDKLAAISESNSSISDIKIVYGFNGDKYVVVECDPIGYMIYHLDSGTFTETSPSSPSPYLGLYGEELYYCGPTRYFQFIDNEFVHTVLGYVIDDSENLNAMIDHSVLITEVLNSEPNEVLLNFVNKGNIEYLSSTNILSESTLMSSTSLASVDGSIGNDGYNWFKSLDTCGYISGGHCGFIGLNMLYAYLDKFVNDKYMPNHHWTDATKINLENYNDSFAKVLYDLDPKNGTTNMHIHKVSKQYLKSKGITDIDHTSRWTPFWTKETAVDIIDNGFPVEIFGSLAHNENTGDPREKGNHAVVAYAYNRKGGLINTVESFVVHYGWDGYSEITVVDNLANAFGGIYAMEVTNGHFHDFVKTTKWAMDGSTLYGIEECTICGAEEPIDAYETTVIGTTNVRIDNFLPKSFTGSVDIPSTITINGINYTITTIGNSAFANSSLSILSIPSSVTVIGDYAFMSCAALSDVNFEVSSNLNSIGKGAFYNCTELETISIPASVQTIGNYAFANCTSLSVIDIPNSVTFIGNYAFSNCTWLTHVSLPTTYFDLGGNVFSGCSNVEYLSTAHEGTIGDLFGIISFSGAVAVLQNGNYYIPTSLKAIDYWGEIIPDVTFKGLYWVTSITLMSNVINIGNSAFNGCMSLTNIKIPSSIISIGNDAFNSCQNLEIELESTYQLQTIGNNAFQSCLKAFTTLSLPNILSIGEYAFAGCATLTDVTLGRYVTSIGLRAFWYRIQSITIDSNNTVYKVEGNCLIRKAANSIMFGYGNIHIPSGIVSIEKYAFEHNPVLKMIVIPASVATMETGVFYGCAVLESISFAPDSALKRIDNATFRGCSALKNITLPSSLTSIATQAFYNCGNLTSITIASSITSVELQAFANCNNLTIYAQATAKPSGWNANWNNSNRPVLWGCTLSGDKSYVVDFNKSSASRISNPNADNGIADPYRDEYYFAGWYSNANFTGTSLTSAQLASASLGKYYACWTSALSYNLINNNTAYEVYTKSTSLADGIVIPTTYNGLPVTKIADSAFADCVNMTTVIIPNTITAIGANAFANCSNLTIYAETSSKPTGWNSNWNNSNRPVLWGCELSADKSYVVSFTKYAGLSNPQSHLSDPYREGFVFGGWSYFNSASGPFLSSEQLTSLATTTSWSNYYANWRSVENVSLTGVSANGYDDLAPTSILMLSFDKDPYGLTIDDITVTGAKKGIIHGYGKSRALTIYSVTSAIVNVSIANTAASIFTNYSLDVEVATMTPSADTSSSVAIKSEVDLYRMAAEINAGGDSMKNYYLTADIYLNFYTDNWTNWGNTPPSNAWTPIGTLENPFKGSFDGNGYKIYGLYNDNAYAHQGLFGVVDGGNISNVRLDQSFINCNSSQQGIVGYLASGTMSNCINLSWIA